MASYLVTGGCGFIGSHLVDALVTQEHQVTVLDDCSAGNYKNVNATYVNGSITDTVLVRELFQYIDGCFHMAAIPSVIRSTEDWLGTHRVNLTGTIHLLDAAWRARPESPIPVVYASSSAVYGDDPHLPSTETNFPKPMSPYGADKLSCELQAYVGGLVHRIPTFGLRFFNVYGPRQNPSSPYSGVISVFMDKASRQETLSIFGDGLQSRDFIYVADVVEHCLAALEKADVTAPVVNVCRGQACSLLTLVETVGTLFNYQPNIKHLPARVGDIYCSMGSPALAKQLLGLEARTTLQEGLQQMMAIGSM